VTMTAANIKQTQKVRITMISYFLFLLISKTISSWCTKVKSVMCIYYQVIHEVHKRVIKLLTSCKSRPNERDIEPFHTKINLSTALAVATCNNLIYKKLA